MHLSGRDMLLNTGPFSTKVTELILNAWAPIVCNELTNIQERCREKRKVPSLEEMRKKRVPSNHCFVSSDKKSSWEGPDSRKVLVSQLLAIQEGAPTFMDLYIRTWRSLVKHGLWCQLNSFHLTKSQGNKVHQIYHCFMFKWQKEEIIQVVHHTALPVSKNTDLLQAITRYHF